MDISEKYYEDFRFGNKKLSDFNGVIYNTNGWKISSGITTSKITEKLPLTDGELFMGYTVDPRVIDVSVFIDGDMDIDEFYAWLLSGEQEFEFVDSGRKIRAILDNQIDITAFYNSDFKGMMDLSFIAYNPYWRAVNEKTIVYKNLVLNSENTLKIQGNVESYPTIKIVPNGKQNKIMFRLNEDYFTLTNVDKPIIIYSEEETVKEIQQTTTEVIVMDKFYSNDYYDFCKLMPFKTNKLVLLDGNVSSIEINCNSRWL